MNIRDSEKARLEEIAEKSRYSEGILARAQQFGYEIYCDFLLEKTVLELGPAEGYGTEVLLAQGYEVTVVDGSAHFVSSIQQRFPECLGEVSLFEEYSPELEFDNIVAAHVLEHVLDPSALLQRVKTWLKPTGRLIVAVPNAHSLHRQIGVEMGLLSEEASLNETDLIQGHRRVYSFVSLLPELRDAGFEIEFTGGFWLKAASNSQIEAAAQFDAFEASLKLGQRYPDISAEIYVVARHKEH